MIRLASMLVFTSTLLAADFSTGLDGELITLGDGKLLKAAVSPQHGGELASLEVYFDGEWRELIHRAKDYSETPGWRGKAPFLWPAVGMTLDPNENGRGYTVDGQFYPMPGHGFARDRVWRLAGHGADLNGAFVSLVLESDSRTRVHYPFDFTVSVDYRIAGGQLGINYTVRAGASNIGSMPFSIGNHVTFRAPLIEGADPGSLTFRNTFPSQLVRGDDRTFSGQVIPSAYRGEKPLSVLPVRRAVGLGGVDGAAEFTVIDPSGLSLHLLHEASREPTKPAIRFNLWADTAEGFFSPEPWLGTQNSLNNGAGLLWLEPGEDWRWTIEITPGREGRPVTRSGETTE